MDPNYRKKPIILKKTPRNTNEADPFVANGESVTEQDDQEQLDKGFSTDYTGFVPVMARMIMRKQALWDMPNKIPGMQNPQQGIQSPWMGAGENPPNDEHEPEKRQWKKSLPELDKNSKEITRNQDSSKISVRENPTVDPTLYNYSEGI